MRFSAATTAERLLPGRLAARARPALAHVDGLLLTPDERGGAGRMSLLAFAIRVVSAAIAFASQVLLARWMGGFEYGIFVLVWVTVVIVGSLACFGFNTAVVRFVPEYRARGRPAELRGVLVGSRLLALVAATLVAAAGLAGIRILSPVLESYYVVPFYLGMICLPMIALSEVLEGIARAHSWALWALAPTYLVRPVLILVFMAAALIAGFEASAETAITAAILATYATTLAQLVAVTARVDRRQAPGRPRFAMRQWLAVSLPIFLVEGFFFLMTNADVLMVGWFLPPGDVGVYFATVKTLALVHFVYFAVKAGVAQRYAAFTHGGETARLEAFARETVSWTFWPSLAMGLVVLALGKPLLMLFGPGFDAGYPLLFVLVPGVLARAAVGPAESLLTMSGHQNVCAGIYAVALAINIGLNIVLIPLLGLWGAAIATALAVGFEATALAFTAWRKLGIVMLVFGFARAEGGAG